MQSRIKLLLALILMAQIFQGCAAKTPREIEAENRKRLRQEIEDEVAVGRQMAARLFGTYRTYQDRSALEYVNLVGQTLARQAGRPELVYRFAILDTEDMNGYACPGGYIFITRGLLKNLRSESELGAVLAHEIAHVNGKHMYESLMPKREIDWTEKLARLFTRGYGDLGMNLAYIVDQGMKVLLGDGYGKEKEVEADRAGVTYTSMLGYDPNALASVLARIENSEKTKILSRTHPPFPERLLKLKTYMKENGLDQLGVTADTKVIDRRFAIFSSSISGGKL